eukprot:9278788-Pyramimonas_sp.AAC.1
MEKSVRAICPDLEDLDLIPDELRGIIFLVNANLDPSERATVVAGLHDWKIELVIEKLKYVWADKDLLARDSLVSRRRELRVPGGRDPRRERSRVNYQEDDMEEEASYFEEEVDE